MKAGILVLLSLLTSTQVLAVKKITMDCETPWPTTTIHTMTEGDVVKMDVVHHNGPRAVPVFTGTVTAGDLELLQGDAEAIAKLGDHWSFQWNIADCNSYGWGLVNCATGKPTKIDSADATSASFNTSRTTERSYSTVQDHTQVSLWITVAGRLRQVMLDYDVKDCRIATE